MSLMAITRGVSASIGSCELTHLRRQPIDVALARQQHQAYEALLRRLGCTVQSLPPDDAYPDCVFVEDAALVLDEMAILLRPGATSRRGETSIIEKALGPLRPLQHIEAPAHVDGGDIIVHGKVLYVGESSRSDAAAVAQIRRIVGPFGYDVRSVPVRGVLHLKSAATVVTDDCLLINPEMVQATAFGGVEVLAVDTAEPFAANALRVGETIVYPTAFPRTAALLRQHGLQVESLDASELAKAEGALTCCSLLFEAKPMRVRSDHQV